MKRIPHPPRLWIAILLYPAAALSLLIAMGGAFMWIRSNYVAERCGWQTLRHDGNDKFLNDISFWSAKGGVGMYREEYRNLWNNSPGSPFFHSTDAMAMYPYISVVAAGVPETRRQLGPFSFSRSVRDREHLAMEMNGQRFYTADGEIDTSIVIPWWSFCAMGAILPLIAIRRISKIRRWRRRNRAGLCATCGYDLRATPEKCPECGTIPSR
jgi:hypothetical protein